MVIILPDEVEEYNFFIAKIITFHSSQKSWSIRHGCNIVLFTHFLLSFIHFFWRGWGKIFNSRGKAPLNMFITIPKEQQPIRIPIFSAQPTLDVAAIPPTNVLNNIVSLYHNYVVYRIVLLKSDFWLAVDILVSFGYQTVTVFTEKSTRVDSSPTLEISSIFVVGE